MAASLQDVISYDTLIQVLIWAQAHRNNSAEDAMRSISKRLNSHLKQKTEKLFRINAI